ncbi:hypothetical protein [Arenimonas fontis]|uniref:Uncharacterized protein n=1 Tax=Arenimonas fontis TaxID=2608255 RepID=A0A5B2ZB92_9GAMM|nr:hypothetical protein [Arenimonas fontis]KAA2284421.1 hypothetical protein F0415_08810 [Arenimonas fontis]
MTRSTRSASKARPARAAATPVTARNLLLAGLGAVAIGRRQAAQAVETLAAAPEALRERACAAAEQARSEVAKLRRQAEKKIAPLRRQAEAKVAPLRKQALAFADQAQAEFETRLQPVLARFGLADKPTRARRRSAAKKATRRPAARKASKRARRA